MEKENRLTFIDEDGNEVLCEILFTFESKEFNKNYVLFYPVGGDEDEIEVMAASYIPTEDGEGELQAIETAEEWQMIEEVLDRSAKMKTLMMKNVIVKMKMMTTIAIAVIKN